MNYSDKVAADKTSLGFEFQDFVFIEKLIELKPGQVVGLELHDDIHVETTKSDGSIRDFLLIQVKHSVDGDNITDRDVDLWKTLFNWIKILPGLPKYETLKLQLYTNKSLNDQKFVSLLKTPHSNIQAILEHIRDTNKSIQEAESKKSSDASPNPIAKYVEAISNTSDENLQYLFQHFEFHSDTTEVIQRLSTALRQLAVPASRIEEARKHVIGAFKESKFSRIIKGQKVCIGFEDFRTSMGFDRIIRTAREDQVDFDKFVDVYYAYERPDKISFSSSRFHNQLQDIGIKESEIIKRGIEMMLGEKFINSLVDSGTFSVDANNRLENIAHADWELIHSQSHRKTNTDDEANHREASIQCYETTMRTSLRVNGIELPTQLSCGKLIKLSDQPRIGWRKDWENKFKK
jgi:hypothetical protein